MNKHVKFLLVASLVAFSLLVAAKAQAVEVDTSYVPLTTVPGIFKQGTMTNPVAVLKGLYGFAIGAGAIIGVVMIIYAGFEYMYKESITGKSDAKQRILNVFLGLAVILGSYILLRTINPDLVNFNVNLPGGNGRVAHVAIAQNMSDAARAQTKEALAQSATLRSEIAKLEEEAAKLQADIDNRADNPNPADAARLAEIEKSIREKKVLDSSLRTQADLSTVTTSIDENIYLRAAGLTKNEDNLASKHASALGYFDRQINELKALDQNDPAVKKAVDQVTARKGAAAEEFGQQVQMEKVLVQYKDNPLDQKKSYAATVINDIRRDAETQGKKLRDAGLEPEARQFEERAQTRISALCGANLCAK